MQHMDSLLINALVFASSRRAGGCLYRPNNGSYRSSSVYHRPRRKEAQFREPDVTEIRRSRVALQQQQFTPVQLTRDDFKGLVASYSNTSDGFDLQLKPAVRPAAVPEPQLDPENEPQRQSTGTATHKFYSPRNPDGPSFGPPFDEKTRQSPIHPYRNHKGLEDEDKDILITQRKLAAASGDIDRPWEDIFMLYKELPSPGVRYLSRSTVKRILYRMSVTEQIKESSMMNYLSILNDMKLAGQEITTDQWTSGMHLAGRCFAKVTAAEAESALLIWKEMEHSAGVKSSEVTFGVLYDVAVKAGKFRLADMILKEMDNRGLKWDRFHHVGMIYYYGLKGEGEKVREAYHSLVEAGEIVDTVVINCVIASLLRAGETSGAVEVFERMKRLHAKSVGIAIPLTDWRGVRNMRKLFVRIAALFKEKAEERRKFQESIPIAPNLITYSILIEHYGVKLGELDRVIDLLNEMPLYKVNVSGRIFIAILKGFSNHGGIRYSIWTQRRLESVWEALSRACSQGTEDVYLGKWMAIWALRAFAKCAGRDRTLEVWEEIKNKWKPTVEDAAVVQGVMGQVLVSRGTRQ